MHNNNNQAAKSNALQSFVNSYQQAINSADIDSLIAHYRDNAIQLPPNLNEVTGVSAIKKRMSDLLSAYPGAKVYIQVNDTKVEGEMATIRCKYEEFWQEDKEQKSINGDWLFVLEKLENQWLISTEIWNHTLAH